MAYSDALRQEAVIAMRGGIERGPAGECQTHDERPARQAAKGEFVLMRLAHPQPHVVQRTGLGQQEPEKAGTGCFRVEKRVRVDSLIKVGVGEAVVLCEQVVQVRCAAPPDAEDE